MWNQEEPVLMKSQAKSV